MPSQRMEETFRYSSSNCRRRSDARLDKGICLEKSIKQHLPAGQAFPRTDIRKAPRIPFSGHAFVFSNRSRKIIKILLWEKNGFWILQKRLEKQRFRWPKSESEVMQLTKSELRWLLDGLDPLAIKGHQELKYSEIYWQTTCKGQKKMILCRPYGRQQQRKPRRQSPQ